MSFNNYKMYHTYRYFAICHFKHALAHSIHVRGHHNIEMSGRTWCSQIC